MTVIHHIDSKDSIMIVVRLFNMSGPQLWYFTVILALLMPVLLGWRWQRMTRVGEKQVTLTDQLTSLRVEIQKYNITLGAAPMPPILPNFQNSKFPIFHHNGDG